MYIYHHFGDIYNFYVTFLHAQNVDHSVSPGDYNSYQHCRGVLVRVLHYTHIHVHVRLVPCIPVVNTLLFLFFILFSRL